MNNENIYLDIIRDVEGFVNSNMKSARLLLSNKQGRDGLSAITIKAFGGVYPTTADGWTDLEIAYLRATVQVALASFVQACDITVKAVE